MQYVTLGSLDPLDLENEAILTKAFMNFLLVSILIVFCSPKWVPHLVSLAKAVGKYF